MFSDPVRYIVEPGGHIIFAQLGDDIVGTCALLNAAIKTFQSLGGSELFLESNTSMSAAMNLYETSGFVRVEGRSHYARSDVYMVYRPEQPEPERQAQSEDSD